MGSCLGSGVAALLSADSLAALGRDAAVLVIQLDALAGQILTHEEQIATLRQQRAVLQDAVEKIQSLTFAASDVISGMSIVPSADGPPAQAAPTLAAPTLADEIEVVIRAANAPLHYKEILNRLQAAGVTVGGKEPAATLLSILANKRYEARFARSERGIYTLAGITESRVPTTRPSKRRRRPARARRLLERSA